VTETPPLGNNYGEQCSTVLGVYFELIFALTINVAVGRMQQR
jgi:hypothetical protein